MRDENLLAAQYRDNAFSDVLLGFAVSDPNRGSSNIFSDAFGRAVLDIDSSTPTFPMGQVFEIGVLKEIELLASKSASKYAERPSAHQISILQKLEQREFPAGLSINEQIQYTAALLNVSRFDAGQTLIERLHSTELASDQAYEVGILQFILSNRHHGGVGSEAAFSKLRALIRKVQVPATKIVEAAALAVVWHLKTGEISEETANWFRAAAETLISDGGAVVSPEAKSSWYRAFAMVPAAKKDIVQTREIMASARIHALEAIEARGQVFARNYLKTYYESSVKEHLYVSSDLDRALEAADRLVELDPHWSESWYERGEVYQRRGEFEKAEKQYDVAVSLGAPYYLMHAYQRACCRLRSGRIDEGLHDLIDLLSLDSTNRSAVVVGYKYAQATSSPMSPYFVEKLSATLSKLSASQKTFLESGPISV
ncbi:hypothetical protein [Burkholderia glumae]|uniref:hypothetical protein n=1 Tax=Burkholderia glumae TaxID=337 RepID=UPI003B9B7A5D